MNVWWSVIFYLKVVQPSPCRKQENKEKTDTQAVVLALLQVCIVEDIQVLNGASTCDCMEGNTTGHFCVCAEVTVASKYLTQSKSSVLQ